MDADLKSYERELERQKFFVHKNRLLLQERKEELMKRKKQWEEENKDLIDLVRNTEETLQSCEEQVRSTALLIYARTNNKRPAAGVQIQMRSVLTYDEQHALAWAIEHKLCLQLIKKEFEAIAKSQTISFVQSHDVPTATIATDLSKHTAILEGDNPCSIV